MDYANSVHSADMVRCLIHRMGPRAEDYLHDIRANSPGHASFTQERTLCTSQRGMKVTIYDPTIRCLHIQPYRFPLGIAPKRRAMLLIFLSPLFTFSH